MSAKKFRATVMISSTSEDLKDHREKVINACLRAKMFPDAMESYTALAPPNSDAISMSLNMVEECDIYLGIFGKRYGYIPNDPTRNPNGYSITEMEYWRAVELGKPMLIFVMDDDHIIPAHQMDNIKETEDHHNKRREFLKKVRERIVGFFSSSIDLQGKAIQALFEYYIKNNLHMSIDDTQQILVSREDRTSLPPLPELYSVPRYNLTKRFIGRVRELEKLDEWVNSANRVMVVEAIGGMGKSALTWEWTLHHANDLMQPAGVMWWSFYEGGATVEGFIRHALAYITQKDPDSLKDLTYEERANQLINELNRRNFLLVMDGFERVLVAYHRIDRAHMRDEQVEESQDYRNCTDPRDAEFIRRLAELRNSKVLISTRLMPAAFEEFNLVIDGVDHIPLKGLSEDDALELFRDLGVKVDRATPSLLTEFFRHIGYHSLIIKIVAINVAKDHRLALGDFDHWYRHHGMHANLALMAAHDKRNHILHYAFNDLSDNARHLLGQIAAFSDPIDFDTLSIFNMFVPPRPPMPQLPPLPQTRPSPFGSARLAWLKDLFYRENSTEEREKIQRQIDEEQAELEKNTNYILNNQTYLKNEYNRVKQQRHRMIEQYELKYRSSTEYLRGIEEFDQVLTELEERGLLSWDREADIYDLHPVVRGYSLSLLPDEARQSIFTTIIGHLGEQEVNDDHVKEVIDLRARIEFYRALVNTGELDIAARYYNDDLSGVLSRLGANYVIVELIKPLFSDGLESFPPLENKSTASYLSTHLARAMQRMGAIRQAQELFGLSLDPNTNVHNNSWTMAISVIDYGQIMLEYNAIARTVRAFHLAEQLTPHENIGWAYYDNMMLAVLMGNWDEAQRQYNLALNGAPPSGQPVDWQARLAYQYALMLVCCGQDAREALADADDKLQASYQKVFIGRLREVEALFWLQQGDFVQAHKAISEAIEIANQTAESPGVRYAILARILQAQGQQQNAQRILIMAQRDRQIVDGGRANLFAHLAHYFLRAGDRQQAQRFAEQAYDFAWADGMPYIRWYPLSLAKQVFNELGIAHPILSVWDDSLAEPIPHEDEIREMYIKDGELITIEGTKPKVQETVMIKGVGWFQVGTIAVFGVDDNQLIETIASKLASLSYIPTPVYFSRMGEEVPFPEEMVIADENRQFEELKFTLEERKVVDKCFIITYIETTTEDNQKAFVYFNVRGDRLKPLIEKLNSGEVFNISNNVTLVLHGIGDVGDLQREKLRRDYLFGEYTTNVRIFPPLDEVTGNGTTQKRSASYVGIKGISSFQIGVVATFGIKDEELISGLAYKFTRLSDNPTKPVFSHMGQEVPNCEPDGRLELETLPFHQLMFSVEERRNLDKAFLIARLLTYNEQGRPAYAYINMRGDRVENLLAQCSKGELFDLSAYATIVHHSEGFPTPEVEEKLQRDYLFRDECLSVRIFESLDQVNKEGAPLTGSAQQRNLPYVETTRFSTVQIGTLAIFGIKDEELILNLAYKLTRLSDHPTKPSISYMGDEVPECPPDGRLNVETISVDQLGLTFEEKMALDRVFAIVRITSKTNAGQLVYRYVNVRGDRMEALLKKGQDNEEFNIAAYATIVSEGEGTPPPDVYEKLYNDYLFRDNCLVVRIFPPLSEVT